LTEYRIFETDQFRDDLASRLGPYREKIIAKLRNEAYPELRRQPHVGRNIKKLRGFKPETWRYRIGMYRFFFTIDDSQKIVFMLAADTRQQSY
jgi:mRNA interferase RelE/StbE